MSRQPAATLLSVYRKRNAPVLGRLAGPALAAGWTVRLWALDEPVETLAAFTEGSGPGTKFGLVNRLLAHAAPDPDDYVVVADDDAQFVFGDLVRFVATADRAGLGLSQPAHVLGSNISHRITWMRPLSRARLTTFVEIGPVFAVAAGWRQRVLPFPENVGMGWGLDIEWMTLRDEGCRLGIVDRTALRHLQPFGTHYALAEEAERMTARLRDLGASGWEDLRRTLATWWLWRRRAPWLEDGLSGD